jgi:hypothetical protein
MSDAQQLPGDDRFTELHNKLAERRAKSLAEPRAWPPADRVVAEGEHAGLRYAVTYVTPLLPGLGSGFCGYVHVPPGHPDCGKFYDDVPVEVHGGLTFVLRALDLGMWFGFDCNHLDDERRAWCKDTVAAEAMRLAEQLAERGEGGGA